MNRPLLVMPCSARKSAAPGLIPARDRYDGSAWRTLRANRAGLELDVLVLSAAHGFIHEELPIADYDRKLDRQRGDEILGDISAPWFAEKVRASAGGFFMGSKLYLNVMFIAAGLAGVKFDRPAFRGGGLEPARCAGIGEQLGDLKNWLAAVRARQELSC